MRQLFTNNHCIFITLYLYTQLQNDKRMSVTFQDNTWSDEAVMKVWIRQQRKLARHSPEIMLVLDAHKAQTTDDVRKLLKETCKTNLVMVPTATTSLVQPVDVVFNAPFKAAIDTVATAHLQEHLDEYVRGKINVSARRVLFTKWVGQAWENMSAKKDTIIRSFKKCGIFVAIDGSEDSQVNIAGKKDYEVGESEEEATDDDVDPFEDEDLE